MKQTFAPLYKYSQIAEPIQSNEENLLKTYKQIEDKTRKTMREYHWPMIWLPMHSF
jgi:hypothetical protein